jgi:Predicted transcriptional regulators
MNNKQYYNIKEVSKLLNLKEHVIRHWDSIDPKTKKLRVQGLSTRSKGGTRYFNKENIKKLNNLKNVLFENGQHNYSLQLADKIISKKRKNNKISINQPKFNELSNIINNLKKALDDN